MAPTKAELLDLADEHDVDVDERATKAEITDALSAAGVDVDGAAAKRNNAVPGVGSVVSFTYRDTGTGSDVERRGVVLGQVDSHPDGTDRLDDDGNASPGVVVGWFDSISDPIDAQQLQAAR